MKTNLSAFLKPIYFWRRFWGRILNFNLSFLTFLAVLLCYESIAQNNLQNSSEKKNSLINAKKSAKNPIKLLNKTYTQRDGLIYVQEDVGINAANLPTSAAGTPCSAHRWFAGDGWRQNTSDNTLVNKWEALTLSSPNLQPKGIVRCASSAETESGLQAFKASYDIASNPIASILPKTDCYSMNTETFGNSLAAPTQGEDIVWLNFDIRPLAGTYQFQIVCNENVGFVLFNVDPADAKPLDGITTGTKYPVPDDGLSGNCANLDFANIVRSGIIHPACGLSGNGWTTITVPSFKKPTNYYLAMWMADVSQTTFPNSMNLVYKSRYGCGGATCTLEYDKSSVVCNNNGTYSVCLDYGGSEGRWAIKDNTGFASSISFTTYKQDGTTIISTGSTPTNPLLMTLGTIPDGAVFGRICATYPIGKSYDISLVPDTTYKPNNNYIQCADGDRQTGTSPTTATMVADATPHCTIPSIGVACVDLTSAAHSAQLTISSVSPGTISDYNYLWVKPLNAAGTLTGSNTATATYTAAVADASQTLEFTVYATPKDSSKCATSSLVTVIIGSKGTCSVSGPDSICGNTTNTYTGSPNPVPDNATYEWVLSGYGGVGITNATFASANGLATIDVLSSNQSYRLTLNQTYANPDLNSSCFIDVYIKPNSSSTTEVAVCSNTPTYLWNGSVRIAPGTYTYTTTNAVGCDSVATLLLTVKDTSTSTTRIAVCNNTLPFVWNGTNYSTSGTYSKRFAGANAVGCDSVAYLILTVKDTSISTTRIAVCNNSLPYVWNGTNYTSSGTYSKLFEGANAVGCDSVAYLILTIKDTSTSTTRIAVCNNALPYVWNGTNYSTSGTYSKRFAGANAVGCDSVAYLILTVRDTTTSTTNVSVCSNTPTYLWNGILRSAPGNYSYTTTNGLGCDSIAYLILTVKDTSTSTTRISVCNNTLPYVWNGTNYSTSGTYSKRFAGANAVGCDSVAYLVLTVKDTSISTTRIAVCNNTLPYVWNGTNYSTSGTYSKRFAGANAVGCDSVAYLVLTVKDTSTSTTRIAVCNNTIPFVWNGTNYSTSGTYSKRFAGANAVGCDSVAYLVLTVKDTTTSTTRIAVCNNTLPYVWNGTNYSTSGTYSKRFVGANAVGCDSVAYLVLTVKDTTTSTTRISVCNNTLPYVWNGTNYSTSGTYSKRFAEANAVGCDSVAYLILTVKDTSTSTTRISVCNNTLPYVWNGTNYSASGTYSKRFAGANAVGCDSVAYLILTVKDTTTSTTRIAVCNNTLPYVWNGTNYSASGTYSKRFAGANAVGCDSVAYLILTVKDTTTSTTRIAVCNNTLPYVWNGTNYSVSGTYSKRFAGANAVGCDSVAYLILTVKDTTTSTTRIAVCNNTLPYVWNGTNYSASGTYSKRFAGANAVGCDSVAYLVLTVKDTTTSTTRIAVCNNTLPYVWNGTNYSTSGTYSKRFAGANAVGCDSVAYLILTVKDTTTSTTRIAVCNNTLPYVWNETNYSTSGTYSKRFAGANAVGCDSVAYLVLTVKDTSTSTTRIAVCNNTLPYVWNGTNYTTSGTYSKRFAEANAVGCDSVAYLILTVKDTSTSRTEVSICSDYLPYLWNGVFYSVPGTYTYTTTNAVGCDSVTNLIFNVNPSPRVNVNSPTDCNFATITATPETGLLTDYNYSWTVPAGAANPGNVSSFTTNVSGSYIVIITDKITLCSSPADTGIYIPFCPCDSLKTFTQGGWGAVPRGNNPGSYLHYPGRFATIFPNGLMIGCASGNSLKLTTAMAVTNFLPSGSTPRALPSGMLLNPTRSTYMNVFAGQLVALTLNVKMDSAFANFGVSIWNLKDMYIAYGPFMGWTVSMLLDEANRKIGGCSMSPYSFSQFNEAADNINNSFDGGTLKNGYLTCRMPATMIGRIIPKNPKQAEQFAIQLSPNPTKNVTNIIFQGRSGEIAILTVYDIAGKSLKTEKFVLNNNGLNSHLLKLDNYADQVLMISIECGNRISTARLVIHQ